MPYFEETITHGTERTWSLNVAVIGAGIAGLTSAIALRQSGHRVQIFEKSAFAAETGAALVISPNGARVLESLGFDFVRSRARILNVWETLHGSTLERYSSVDFTGAERRFGQLVRSVHRVDLHEELLRLALGPGGGEVSLHLSSAVISVDAKKGRVRLADGTFHGADVIVAADGVHSIARKQLAPDEAAGPATGMSAFRFLLPTERLQADSVASELLKAKPIGCAIFADTADKESERHMVWYDCRNGEVQNFVGIHPSRSSSKGNARDDMRKEFGHFHPALVHMIDLADDIMCWPLYHHKPLQNYLYDKVILIGDAAHPMLPFGGQGSNQAIEDAGALGQLLHGIRDQAELRTRLRRYEVLRLKRTSMVQILSGVRVGREAEVEEELGNFAENGNKVPGSFAERIDHHYSYDVLKAARTCSHADGLLRSSR